MDLNVATLPVVTKDLPIHGSRLTNFHRNASSALLQLVNQRLNFLLTHSRTHAFRYGCQNKNSALIKRIELKTFALAGVQVTY